MASDTKYLVMKGPRTGLGDLIRALAVGILYARETKRKLWIEWKDGFYQDASEDSFPDLFDTKGDIFATQPPPLDCTVTPPTWSGYLDRSFTGLVEETGWDWDRVKALTRYSADPGNLNYPEEVVVIWAFDHLPQLAKKAFPITSRWHPMIERKVFQEYFLKHISIKPEIAQQIEHFKQRHFQKRMIAVHARFSGDSRSLQRIPIEVLEQHVEGILSECPDAGLFLATDSIKMAQQFKEKYNHVVTLPKWLPEEGESMLHSAPKEERKQNNINALMDMALLSACDFLIHPVESSFSTVSACMSKAPISHIFPVLPDSNYSSIAGNRKRWRKVAIYRFKTSFNKA